MHKHALRAVQVLLLGLVLQQGTAEAATLKDRFEKTYPFREGSTLSLDNVNGGIKITAWDRDEVRVVAEKKVKAKSDELAKKVLGELKIEIAQAGGGLQIVTRYPKRNDGFLAWLSGNDASASVTYTLQVPRRADLDVESVNGGIDVSGVQGDFDLDTTNGGIEVAGADGRLDLDTTNGGIAVTDSAGAVQAETTNGGIKVELADVPADADLRFSTTNGGITVRLPRDIRASVHASTTNGSVETDLPIEVRGKISKKRLDGDINGGGGRLDLRTTNGGIHILEHGR